MIRTNIAASKGGSERVAIASNVAQATTQVCRKVILVATLGNAGTIRVNIGSACTADTGIPVTIDVANVKNHIQLDIEDVGLLYFYGTDDADTVDILWLY